VALAGVFLSAVGGADEGRSTRGSDPPPPSQDRQRATRAPDIYFAATRQAVADAMLQLAGVTANDVVYDLGSGDGRIVILAAQKYAAQGVGIEIDGGLVETARRTAREGGVEDRVRFVIGDLFDMDVSKADVVTLYLSASINASLEAKLRRELKPGARIVSHQFPIGRWMPDRTVAAVDGTDLYLWTIR
jgi:cyclopropane fatty-acyl-phospholipid synthase-like methyltransferase